MKCASCGYDNKDNSSFCASCGATLHEIGEDIKDIVTLEKEHIDHEAVARLQSEPFVTQFDPDEADFGSGKPIHPLPPPQQVTAMPATSYNYAQQKQQSQKKPLTLWDVFAIFGFAASLVGLFTSWVMLEPLACIASITAFLKKTSYKQISAAGFVIAIISFLVQLGKALYENNIVGRWFVNGILF